jgi:hypothetical protein
MTDFRWLAGSLHVAGCGAIREGIVHAGKVAGSRMGSAAAEKSALCAGHAGRSTWARIGGGNGRNSGLTRFVICYLTAFCAGENALTDDFRWFLGLMQAAPAAGGAGVAVQFREGGRGSRARRVRSHLIHFKGEKIFTLPT